jgi:hypothetical protein
MRTTSRVLVALSSGTWRSQGRVLIAAPLWIPCQPLIMPVLVAR